MCGGEVGLRTRIWLENVKEGNRLEYLVADGRIILKLILKRGEVRERERKSCYSVRDKCLATVNTVMDLDYL
jgi:hypothetical protein